MDNTIEQRAKEYMDDLKNHPFEYDNTSEEEMLKDFANQEVNNVLEEILDVIERKRKDKSRGITYSDIKETIRQYKRK